MRVKTAIAYAIAIAVIFGVVGVAAGGEYVMSQADVLDAQRAVQQRKVNEDRVDTMNRYEQTAVELNRQLYACQVQFQASTVLYEPAPGLQLSLGLRGVGIAPSANQTPRWVIPARVKPQVLSGSPGGLYYYLTSDNRMDGPYVPQVAQTGAQQ